MSVDSSEHPGSRYSRVEGVEFWETMDPQSREIVTPEGSMGVLLMHNLESPKVMVIEPGRGETLTLDIDFLEKIVQEARKLQGR